VHHTEEIEEDGLSSPKQVEVLDPDNHFDLSRTAKKQVGQFDNILGSAQDLNRESVD
jgi:hypothetical protein